MKLFKFRSALHERDLDALLNNQLYFSSYEDLNDPYEGWSYGNKDDVNDNLRIKLLKYVFQKNGASKIDAENKVNIEYLTCQKKGNNGFSDYVDNQYIEKLINYFNKHKKSICSMSACMDDHEKFPEVIASMMMWSHYANGFKGFCLEFDAEKLISSLQQNSSNVNAIPVNYSENGDLPVINLSDYYNDIINGTDNASNAIHNALSTKANCWAYEREVRLIGNNGLHQYDIRSLKAIYIPTKASPDLTKSLMEFVLNQKTNINIYEVILHNESYKLGLIKLNDSDKEYN